MKKLLLFTLLFGGLGNQAQASFLDSMNKIKGYFYNKSPLYGCEGNFTYRGNDKYLIVDKVQNIQGNIVASLQSCNPNKEDLQITYNKQSKQPISAQMTIDTIAISNHHLQRNENDQFKFFNNKNYFLTKNNAVENPKEKEFFVNNDGLMKERNARSKTCGTLTYERKSFFGTHGTIETIIPEQPIKYSSYFVPRISYSTLAGTTMFGAFLGFVYTKTKS